MKKHCI